MKQFFFFPATESAPATEQPLFFPQPQTTSLDESLRSLQHGASPLEEACYNELVEFALLDQLIERPDVLAMISDPSFTLSTLPGFEQGPDANTTSVNDLNFNQSIASYTQDFSHYNDLQFNMLVNENQTLQSEVQDSPSSMVHVKIEEELWRWGRILHFKRNIRHFGKYAYYL